MTLDATFVIVPLLSGPTCLGPATEVGPTSASWLGLAMVGSLGRIGACGTGLVVLGTRGTGIVMVGAAGVGGVAVAGSTVGGGTGLFMVEGPGLANV